MKRTTLLAAIVLIFVATYAFEFYANSQFKDEELTITGLGGLELGKEHAFEYLKAQELVGTYTYSLETAGDGYLMSSETIANNGEDQIQLIAEYTFSAGLIPEEYTLAVLSNDERTDIRTDFTGEEIVTYVTFEGVTLNITEVNQDGLVVIENNMPGFWEVLFNSITLEGGVKYSGNIFIPQGSVVFPITLVVSKKPQNIMVNGEQLSCTVVKEADLDLAFYIYEGELVQMRNDSQELMFQKVR